MQKLKCKLCGGTCKRTANYQKYCPICRPVAYKQARRKWWNKHKYKNKIKQKHNNLLRLYNITLEQYKKLLSGQYYRCAICNARADKFDNNLSVDHDHQTGKVRGLLCNHCNLNLGWFENNKNSILKYLGE